MHELRSAESSLLQNSGIPSETFGGLMAVGGSADMSIKAEYLHRVEDRLR